MDEMDEMSELTLDKLPEDILLKIFVLLQKEDYGNFLKLTEVCSTFNNIISSSSRLLSLYTIQMNRENINLEWIGSRTYPRFEVNHEMIDRFLDILPVHGKFIKSLHIIIQECTTMVKLWKLRKVFSACSNLKDVIFTDDSCAKLFEDYVKPSSPMIALDELLFNGSPECFKIFENCTTKTFDTYFKEHNPVLMLKVQKFMKKQNNLKELLLTNDDNVKFNMFNNDELDHVNFRLNYFSLCGFKGIKKSKKFNTFISQHRDTLEKFILQHSNSDLLPYFSNFKVLKSLILKHIYLPNELNLVLNSVENVELRRITGHFIGLFPKLKHLTVQECNEETNIEISSDNVPHLESIEMNDFRGSFLLCPTPSLKKMVFTNVIFADILFDFDHNKIEEIELDSCGYTFWLPEFLDCEYTNVIKLTLKDLILSTLIIKAIERNQHKISQLKIEDCCFDLNFDTDDWYDWYNWYAAASGPHYILDVNGELIKGDKDGFDYEW